MDFLFPKKLFENKVLNAFYFMFKALFVLKISNFCWLFFGHAGKPIDKKTKVNFKIYDVTDWGANSYNTHIAQYLKKYRQTNNEIWSVNKLKIHENSWKFIH